MIYKFISLHEKNKIYKISYDCQQEKRHIAGYEKRNAYNNLQEKWNKLLIAVYKEKTETSYSSLQQKSTKIAYRLQKKKKIAGSSLQRKATTIAYSSLQEKKCNCKEKSTRKIAFNCLQEKIYLLQSTIKNCL